VFPRFRRRHRLTSSASSSTSDYAVLTSDFKAEEVTEADSMLIMSSTDRNKQSILMNKKMQCENNHAATRMMNAKAMAQSSGADGGLSNASSSSSDDAGPTVCVTLGPVPSPSS